MPSHYPTSDNCSRYSAASFVSSIVEELQDFDDVVYGGASFERGSSSSSCVTSSSHYHEEYSGTVSSCSSGEGLSVSSPRSARSVMLPPSIPHRRHKHKT